MSSRWSSSIITRRPCEPTPTQAISSWSLGAVKPTPPSTWRGTITAAAPAAVVLTNVRREIDPFGFMATGRARDTSFSVLWNVVHTAKISPCRGLSTMCRSGGRTSLRFRSRQILSGLMQRQALHLPTLAAVKRDLRVDRCEVETIFRTRKDFYTRLSRSLHVHLLSLPRNVQREGRRDRIRPDVLLQFVDRELDVGLVDFYAQLLKHPSGTREAGVQLERLSVVGDGLVAIPRFQVGLAETVVGVGRLRILIDVQLKDANGNVGPIRAEVLIPELIQLPFSKIVGFRIGFAQLLIACHRGVHAFSLDDRPQDACNPLLRHFRLLAIEDLNQPLAYLPQG